MEHFKAVVAPICLATLFALQSISLQAQQPFGFRLEFGACSRETFDSFTGTFTRELGTPKPATAKAALTPVQMNAIADSLRRVGFFEMPEKYVGTSPDVKTAHEIMPFTTYRLEVRLEGNSHTVVWEDKTRPVSGEAGRFRDMLAIMIDMIQQHPAVQRLPLSNVGCK